MTQARANVTNAKAGSADERRFRLIVEAVPTAVVLIDQAGEIVLVNRQTERAFGYSKAELIGQPVEVLVPERFRSRHPTLRDTFFAEPRPRLMGAGRDLYGLRKDGSEFPVEIGLAPIEIDESMMVLSTIIDISARKAAEVALRESEQRHSLLVDGVSDYAIYMLDPNGIVTNWNRGAQRIKGYRTEEILGQHFSRFYTKEDREANLPQQSLEIAACEGRFEAEAWRVRKDGSRFLANVVIDALKDERGRLIGFAKITRDVSERVQAARELQEARAQAELAHVARVINLGQLAASIAHEVSQPLAGLVADGYASRSWLTAQPPNIEDAIVSIDGMIQAAMRASEIVHGVRALVTKASIQKVPLEINEVINQALALVQHEVVKRGVLLRTEFAQALPLVLADRVQLQQVIINLVMNGIEAMDGVASRPPELVIRSQLDEAGRVAVIVEDCGVGLSADITGRLFNAFFSTKSSGMGMGLSICRSIIEALGGQISAANNPGPGATFRFTLPS